MTKKSKNIEDIFRVASENYSYPVEYNWENVSKATRKKLFFKFNFQNFNIYYLVAIIMLLLGFLLLFISNEEKGIDKNQDLPSIYVNDSISTNLMIPSLPINDSTKIIVKKDIKIDEKSISKPTESKETTVTKEDSVISIDEIKQIPKRKGEVVEKNIVDSSSIAHESKTELNDAILDSTNKIIKIEKDTTIVKKADTVFLENRIKKTVKKRVRRR